MLTRTPVSISFKIRVKIRLEVTSNLRVEVGVEVGLGDLWLVEVRPELLIVLV